jgi:DNA-binding MarR family transcriptional regulator
VNTARSGGDGDAGIERLLEVYRRLQIHHARVVQVHADRYGLGLTDLRFLFAIAARGNAGVVPKEATALLGLSTGATTSLIDRLEKRGYVERIPNPDDRRSVTVAILDAGVDVVDSVKDVYRRAFETAVPATRIDQLAADLESFDLELTNRAGTGD